MERASLYRVEGIGHDFMVDTLDLAVVDEVMNVSDRDSFLMARRLPEQEGISIGGSTGTVFVGALEEARRQGPGKIVVAIVCDGGDRYISKVFNDEWMRDMGYFAPDSHLGTVQDWKHATRGRSLLQRSATGISQMPVDPVRGIFG